MRSSWVCGARVGYEQIVAQLQSVRFLLYPSDSLGQEKRLGQATGGRWGNNIAGCLRLT